MIYNILNLVVILVFYMKNIFPLKLEVPGDKTTGELVFIQVVADLIYKGNKLKNFLKYDTFNFDCFVDFCGDQYAGFAGAKKQIPIL